MVKHKLFNINIDKEEAWINQVISQGYRLKQVKTTTGRYEFEETDSTEPQDFLPNVRIDFRTFKNQEDFADYLTLFEDCGWRHISGTKSGGTQYFEKMRPDCGDEIFSDHCSKAERYKKIANVWLEILPCYIVLLIVFSSVGFDDIQQITSWKELYYTPGLWEMTGSRFIGAFLFETPFALGRAFGGIYPLFLLVIVLCYAYFALNALYWYYKEKKSS